MLCGSQLREGVIVSSLSTSGLFRLTCKLPIRRPPASKLSHQLPVGLKDEDAAGLVVHSDNVSIFIHGHSLGTHEPARTDLVLREGGRQSRILAGNDFLHQRAACPFLIYFVI